MLTFTEFQWAAFLYWAVSYGGNIGGDQDYVPLMTNSAFLERLRRHPEGLSAQEVRRHVIDFLNRWKCRVKDDDATAEAIKRVVVNFKGMASYSRSAKLLDLNNTQDSIRGEIVSLYAQFDVIAHFGPTATSKVMHLLNPDLFVMWDNAILSHYSEKDRQIDGTGRGYFAFLSLMSRMGREVTTDFQKSHPMSKPEIFLSEKLGYRLRKSLAKFMDEYNWITVTKGMAVPPHWWPDKKMLFVGG